MSKQEEHVEKAKKELVVRDIAAMLCDALWGVVFTEWDVDTTPMSDDVVLLDGLVVRVRRKGGYGGFRSQEEAARATRIVTEHLKNYSVFGWEAEILALGDDGSLSVHFKEAKAEKEHAVKQAESLYDKEGE